LTQRFPKMRDELEWLAVKQAGPEAVKRFDDMLAAGQSVSMAAMLATKSAPTAGVDDRVVLANAPSLEEQFKGCPGMLEQYRRNYRAQTGEDLPSDAMVYRGLADYPGDPGAIVTHKHSLADVKREMKRRNRQVEGDWENHPVQQAPTPQVCRINENAMQRYIGEYRRDPDGRWDNATDAELREEITAVHAPVVTADEVMSTPSSLDELDKQVFGS